jgi:small subunit ribosomal protein S18
MKIKSRKNLLGTFQNVEIDHKNVELLRDFLTPTNRIKARRQTGVTAVQQRTLAQAIKRARHLALLPFTAV